MKKWNKIAIAFMASVTVLSAAATAFAEEEPMAYMEMYVCDGNDLSEKKEEVEAAVNEITEELINTHVHFTYIPFSSYGDQLRLAISGGEQVDLVNLAPRVTSFRGLYSQGALKDISGLLQEYGQETLDIVGDLITATTVGDGIYGVTNYNLIAGEQYLIMRKDVLEDLGLLDKALNLSSFTEMEEIFQAVVDSDWDMYPIGIYPLSINNTFSGDDFSSRVWLDNVSDSSRILSIDVNDPEAKIYDYYETEGYQFMIKKMRDWYEKGYYYKDSSVAGTGEDGYSMVKNGKAFSFVVGDAYGIQEFANDSIGMEMVCVSLGDTMITTGNATTRVWCVPATAKQDAAAIKFLNLLYTNADLANLVTYGIEGQDYQVLENGNADYLDGQSIENVHYHSLDTQWGNQFLLLPWGANTETNIREIQKEKMANGVISPYLGFSCDTTEIADQISACSVVYDQYNATLSAGAVDLSEYDSFISALKSAGIDDIIAVYQEQFDAWLGK